MTTRRALKAGTWYIDSPRQLDDSLDKDLALVPSSIDNSVLPIPGARIIIAPHAGYFFSGKCAAWAYRCLDLRNAKRIFILGPSHRWGVTDGCAITMHNKWATPFGNFIVDVETSKEIQQAADFDDIPRRQDEQEHSMELQLPYLWKRCQETFGEESKFPPIVPILVGGISSSTEKEVGKVLLPYFEDPNNAFVISSDFCHWGPDQYGYSAYSPVGDPSKLISLRDGDPVPKGLPIRDVIQIIDKSAMDAIESGSHDAFVSNLAMTGNTVCGRHPIGIAMAALELLAKKPTEKTRTHFKVVQYQRSDEVEAERKLTTPQQYSVSYVAAYAII